MGRIKTKEERLGKRWAKKNIAAEKDETKSVTRHALGLEGKQGQSKKQMIHHTGRGRIRQKVG